MIIVEIAVDNRTIRFNCPYSHDGGVNPSLRPLIAKCDFDLESNNEVFGLNSGI